MKLVISTAVAALTLPFGAMSTNAAPVPPQDPGSNDRFNEEL